MSLPQGKGSLYNKVRNNSYIHACLYHRARGQEEVKKRRKFYHLTSLGGKKRIKFPLDFVPFLNQTTNAVTLHAALDEMESRWFAQFG